MGGSWGNSRGNQGGTAIEYLAVIASIAALSSITAMASTLMALAATPVENFTKNMTSSRSIITFYYLEL